MMNKLLSLAGIITLLLVIHIITGSCKKDPDFNSLDLLDKLNSLDGVSAVEIDPVNNYSRTFQVDVTQPVDHNNPHGAKFTQRVYLAHKDEKMPMVFAPNGYGSSPASMQEIAAVLNTNYLNVTHRYFVNARPDPLDWKYLTIEQAAADHHRIVQLFKKIYKSKWISSGGSKSGLASLFHKRYYPEDVDATIAYVAPLAFGPVDERFPQYLAGIGGGDCFGKLQQVQIYVLNHRAEMMAFMDNYINSGTYTYSLDRELILELDIMDYPFTFWQYYTIPCENIPDTVTSTPFEIFTHFSTIVPFSSFSVERLSYYEPYVYQALTEIGAPAYQTDYLAAHLKKVDPNAPGNPNYELVAPGGVTYTYNYNTIPEIYTWLQNYGDHIIYIYGKNDPWSAGAIELTGAADALFFMQEGGNHNVRISQLDQPDLVYDALGDWLGIPVTPPGRKSFQPESDIPGFRLGE